MITTNTSATQLSQIAQEMIALVTVHDRDERGQINGFSLISSSDLTQSILKKFDDKYDRGLFQDPILYAIRKEVINALEELARCPESFLNTSKCYIRQDILQFIEEVI